MRSSWVIVAFIVFAAYAINSDVKAADPDAVAVSFVNVTVSMTPNEGPVGSEVTIEGSNFPKEGPNSEGPITYWYGYLNTQCLLLGHFESDATGGFTRVVTIPSKVSDGTTNFVYLNRYCVSPTTEHIKFTHNVPKIDVEEVIVVSEPEVISVNKLEPNPTAEVTAESSIIISEPSTKGPVGRTGRTGKRGPRGPEGALGPLGDVGPDGESGPMGPNGIEGIPGKTGPQGPVGPQGESVPFPLIAILGSMTALIIALIRYYYITTP